MRTTASTPAPPAHTTGEAGIGPAWSPSATADDRHVVVIDPLADDRWSAFLATSPEASIFHHPEWLSLLRAQYRYPIHARCVVDADDAILAALPLAHIKSRLTGSRLVAVPFSDLCHPVSRAGEAAALELLLSDLSDHHHARPGTDIEVRCSLSGMGHPGASFYHHVVPLGSDFEAVRAGFSSSTKRGVKKAHREGVEVTYERGAAGLEAFYRMHLITRRRQGVPTQPKRFFGRFARLFEHGLGFVLLARHEGVPVAGAVMLTYNGVLTYKYGASFPSHLSRRPNNAIFMEAIQWGCANGYQHFDLGRTDTDNEGLRTFKRGWGADERTLAYTVLSRRAPKAGHSGVPSSLRAVITRTPPLTGRLIGEALYRHFG
jgi:CelD/BcsL family acetyltransferase involved in cellulose biosynthesis